ncbi:hypothetical protein [Caudoviricetes sp.]|nr:hypothetical protein [Caudoviricetes sp.]
MMKTITVKGLKKDDWSTLSFSLIEKKESEYIPLIGLFSCRSWMCDSLFTLKNKKWKGGKPTYPFEFDYKKGNIYVGVQFRNVLDKQVFLENVPKLQEKEKQAKVRTCKVYETQISNVLVIEGSKFWKDSCWKMMLYTFYIKTFTSKNPKSIDMSYWNTLKGGNEDKLLSKVRMSPSSEIFDDSVYIGQTSGRHSLEGFVSICSGRNPPMAKLLGVVDVNKIMD